MSRQTKLYETAIRKKIDSILSNLGWTIDEEDPNCNVTTEVPKTTDQQKKLNRKEGDYFLYRSESNEILAIIEAKKPDESISKAIKQGVELYAKPLGVNIVFGTDGTIVETYHIPDNKTLTLDDEEVTELLSEKELIKFVKSSSVYTPTEVIYNKRELIRVFAKANNLLRKEGLREGVERFTEFANLLFLKLISEIEQDRENRGEPRRLKKDYCWESFAGLENGTVMLNYINGTILPYLVGKYSGEVFQNTLAIQNPSILKEIVGELANLTLINVDSDIKGDAFEYFLKNSITVGNDLGEYFTPRHIVKLMVKLVDPKFGEIVYDPCCGTGGFLIEAFKHVKRKVKLDKETMYKLENETIYGVELTATAKIAKMNMILAGDGHTNIYQKDSLQNPVKEKYDVIITNFPFSQKTDYSNLYGFETKDANPIFLKHIIDALKDDGRAAVVVFQGILYDNMTVYKKIRRYMLENCSVEAVIQLHNYVFKPYTGVNTSILVLNKGKPTKKVWFFVVDNDGFEKTSSKKGRKRIQDTDMTMLQDAWIDKSTTAKSWTVDIEEIKKNNYSLNADLYKPMNITMSSYPLINLNDEKYFDAVRGKEVGSATYCTINEGVPYIRVGDLTGKGSSFVNTNATDFVLAEENDILLSFDGTIGIVRKGLSGAISAGMRRIRLKNTEVLFRDFVFFALQSKDVKDTMDKYSKTSTIIHAGKSFDYIRIPIPPIEIQKEIAKKLEIKYNKIERINDLLLSLSNTPIDEFLFESQHVDPTPIQNLIKIGPQNGLYKDETYYGKGTPIVRIDNIYDGQIITNEMKYIDLTQKELDNYRLNEGDVLVNRVNSVDFVGKCCVYEGEPKECVFESNMMRFSVDMKKINPRYLVYYLSSPRGRNQILTKIKRAINQVSINQEDVKSINIPLIHLNDQNKIVETINDQFETLNKLAKLKELYEEQIQKEISKLYKS